MNNEYIVVRTIPKIEEDLSRIPASEHVRYSLQRVFDQMIDTIIENPGLISRGNIEYSILSNEKETTYKLILRPGKKAN